MYLEGLLFIYRFSLYLSPQPHPLSYGAGSCFLSLSESDPVDLLCLFSVRRVLGANYIKLPVTFRVLMCRKPSQRSKGRRTAGQHEGSLTETFLPFLLLLLFYASCPLEIHFLGVLATSLVPHFLRAVEYCLWFASPWCTTLSCLHFCN